MQCWVWRRGLSLWQSHRSAQLRGGEQHLSRGGAGLFNHGAGGVANIMNSTFVYNSTYGIDTSGSLITLSNSICYYNNGGGVQPSVSQGGLGFWLEQAIDFCH